MIEMVRYIYIVIVLRTTQWTNVDRKSNLSVVKRYGLHKLSG